MEPLILWIIIASILSALPLILIKQYTLTEDYKWLLCAGIIFMVLIFTYINVIRSNNVSHIGPLIKIIEIILFVMAGIALFNEKLEKKHIIGLVLGCVSIVLLSC